MKWMKFILPVAILVVSYFIMKGIEASASDSAITEAVDTRPTVTIEQIDVESSVITLSSYGEVQPLESTNLAAQVSGEVES